MGPEDVHFDPFLGWVDACRHFRTTLRFFRDQISISSCFPLNCFSSLIFLSLFFWHLPSLTAFLLLKGPSPVQLWPSNMAVEAPLSPALPSHISWIYLPVPLWMLLTASPVMILWLNAFINPPGSVSKTHFSDLLDAVVYYFSSQPYFCRKFQLQPVWGLHPGEAQLDLCALWELMTPDQGPQPSFSLRSGGPSCARALPGRWLDPQRLFSLARGQASLLPSITADGWEHSPWLFS